MQQAVLIRLRPRGPWRYGPSDGGHDRVDTLYRSDRLYSAVTLAMRQLGLLDEWLSATARADQPAVVFSSLFPFQGDTLFVPPPATLWPPPLSSVTTPSPVFLTKIRWNAAHFVPLSLIESLLTGQRILADQWLPDAESGCLLRRDRPSTSPFRIVTRSRAAVDRLTGNSVSIDSSACVEWESGSGLWTVARFLDDEAYQTWNTRLHAALRLLADTGFGGKRSSGWGQTHEPEFQNGSWPSLLFPNFAKMGSTDGVNDPSSLYWLLSLYSPSASDVVDWSSGSYTATVRSGHVESPSLGSGAYKKRVRMIAEGSVLSGSREPVGAAVDVAPDGFEHPVYRSGFALSLLLPEISAAAAPTAELDAILAEAIEVNESITASEAPENSIAEPDAAPPLEEENTPSETQETESPVGEEDTTPEQPTNLEESIDQESTDQEPIDQESTNQESTDSEKGTDEI